MSNESFNTNSIDSGADSSLKGLYLQKVRAANRLLDALTEKNRGIMCTIEYIDDVFEMNISKENVDITAEQNKSYTRSLSINSHEIKNSIRIFFDTWREKTMNSEEIRFVFYTNTDIAKENMTELTRKKGIILPDEPIIKLLKDENYEAAFPVLLPIFKDYYISQHTKNLNRGEEKKINIYKNIIDDMSNEEWKKFFQLIEWNFNQEDEVQLIESTKIKINSLCNKFDVHTKYVNSIYDSIISMIELGTFQDDFLNRVVHVAELKLLFLEKVRIVKSDEMLDPMYKKWDEIDCRDKRNLKEKIEAVCPNYGCDLEELQDDYIDGAFEQKNYINLKAIKSYKYRIYKLCKRHISKTIVNEKLQCFNKDRLDDLIDCLTDECYTLIEDKIKTYTTIPFKDRDMIRKTILILIEECYLAFDEVGEING